jgi:hypothetical protein
VEGIHPSKSFYLNQHNWQLKRDFNRSAFSVEIFSGCGLLSDGVQMNSPDYT